MNRSGYTFRKLTLKERKELLKWRRDRGYPRHSPPHWTGDDQSRFLITAACYEHRAHIGKSFDRTNAFTQALTSVLMEHTRGLYAWCVLPNHYHALIDAPGIGEAIAALGRLHGRASYLWIGEDDTRGRKVFHRCSDRAMRSDRHFWATLNYVHHNPVHHGYVTQWDEWPWSSAADFLAETGRDEAKKIWLDYPIKDYGSGWDDPVL